jgi:hypothetical protein
MLLTTFSGSDLTGHRGARGFCGSGLPVGWQQDGQVVLIGHGGQTLENVGQVGFRVVAVTFGPLDQGVDDGGALTGGFSADEEPVHFSYGRGADAILDEVVVDLDLAPLDEKGEPIPECEGVVNGAAEFSLGQDLGVLAQGEEFAFEDFENGGGLLLSGGAQARFFRLVLGLQ